MRNITPDDLVQYLYNETSPQRSLAIKTALENDWSLREVFEQLASAQKNLKEVEDSPREESLKKILDYAENAISHLHSH